MIFSRHGFRIVALGLCLVSAAAARGDEDVPDKEPDIEVGAPRAVGGPSVFGYTFIDSAEPGGPVFSFVDISTTGTQQTFFDADALPTQNSNADDGVALAISLAGLNGGQGFPFFGNLFTELNMSTNGFLHFDLNGASDALSNDCPVSNATEPNNMIAVLWDDLVLRNPPSILAGGYVQSFSPCPYTQGGTGDCVVVQWDNADHFGGGIDSFDFQAVLYDNGNILMLYPEGPTASPADPPFNPEHGSGSTTGIENADASDGLTYACNTADSIPANLAVLFRYPLPQLELAMTVSVCQPDPADPVDPECIENCGTVDSLIVAPGTKVRVCYGVTNTGTTPITQHNLFDDQIGAFLAFFNFNLLPGASVFITQKVTIDEDTVFNGTWTGRATVHNVESTDAVTVQVDSDGDGVPDAADICPGGDDNIDADADGTPDFCDNCPDDPAKTEPGQCGCGVADTDTDADGTADCNDECVDDPNKIAPGDCGCGVADTDTDNDGTADCNDECVDDPNKIAPGDCGCGVADMDTDNDGTADCNEECDDDSNKTEPGVCGCGTADIDFDNDGVADCIDNCPNDANADQADTDGDDIGDVCDDDGPAGQPNPCGDCGTGMMPASMLMLPLLLRGRHRRRRRA